MSVDEIRTLLAAADAARNRQDLTLAVEHYTALLAIARPQADNPDERAHRLTALRGRGRLLAMMGNQEAALAAYEQYYLEAGTSDHAVDALVLIGNQLIRMARYREAFNAQAEALALAEALNYTLGRAKALSSRGLTAYYRDETEDAQRDLAQALALFEQMNDAEGQVSTLNRLGLTRMRLGEIDKAIQSFDAALVLSRAIDGQLTAVTLSNLGECYQQLYDMEQALIYHTEALALAGRLSIAAVEADLCRNMGVDLVYLGQLDEGLDYLYRALALSDSTQQPDIKAQTLYSLAVAELERGNREKSRQHAEALQEHAESHQARSYMANALRALGLVCQAEGDRGAAEKLWQEALFLAHETGQRMLLWQTHAALAEVSENPGLVSVHCRIADEVIRQIAFPIEDADLRRKFIDAASAMMNTP